MSAGEPVTESVIEVSGPASVDLPRAGGSPAGFGTPLGLALAHEVDGLAHLFLTGLDVDHRGLHL